jgi:DNA invertase Pin-like site-specific DNA recombinase
VLVVAKLDRLSRSLKDFAGLMETAEKQGWAIIALDFGLDMTTPTGEMVANIIAAVSRYERRLIGLRTQEALAEVAKTKRLGAPVLIDARVQADILRLHAEGASLRQIAEALNSSGTQPADGGKRWYASTIKSVLDRLRDAA